MKYIVCISLFLLILLAIFSARPNQVNDKCTHSLSIRKGKDTEKAKNDDRGRILSHLSHEIRTPVIGLNWLIDMAQQNMDNKEKVEECLKYMKHSAEFLNMLVDDVLELNKVRNGILKEKKKQFNIEKILNDCIVITNWRFPEKNVECTNNFCKLEHYNLLGDDLHITQVLLNLITNAVKFSENGGTVRISVEEIIGKDEQIAKDKKYNFRFKVADDGVGMSEEFQKNIWEEFAQEENKMGSKYKGTGLGMPITKNLVEAMGGHISVKSKINCGTTFTVDLPIYIDYSNNLEENMLAGIEKENLEMLENQNKIKVIVVDDDKLNMEVEKFVLEKENITVTAVDAGEKAIKLFENSDSFEYDAILMDINMPQMNGYDTTKKIRELKRDDAKKIPIIAMTADSYGGEPSKIKDAGMTASLIKPIKVACVLKMLDAVAINL